MEKIIFKKKITHKYQDVPPNPRIGVSEEAWEGVAAIAIKTGLSMTRIADKLIMVGLERVEVVEEREGES